MKSYSQRTLIGVLAMGAVAATAVAGDKTSQEVQFSPSKPFVSGDLGFARNTADTVQLIGCTITPTNGVCTARDSAGVVHSCSTTDPGMLDVIRSLKGDSWLAFGWNLDGTCKTVQVRNDSRSAPK